MRTSCSCRWPKISIRSVTSVRAVSTNRSAYAFARASGRDFHDLDVGIVQDRVERLGELPGPVTDQEPEAGGAIPQSHQEVADLLIAGLGDNWKPLELRTSFVSLMSGCGVPVEEIARLVGHTSSRTTEVVYRLELRPVITGLPGLGR
jgi:hypothetical protein